MPIPGTTSAAHALENEAATTLTIAPELLERAGTLIDTATVSGPRYNETNAAEVDAESFGDAA